MSPGSSTESYPAFARIGLRENPGKNLNQVTCPDRDWNPGHLVSRPDALTVTPQPIRYRDRGSSGGPYLGHVVIRISWSMSFLTVVLVATFRNLFVVHVVILIIVDPTYRGPHLMPTRLNEHVYGIFLAEILLELLEDVPINIWRNMIFQHDGLNCRNYLNSIVHETPNDKSEELVDRIILAFDDLRNRPQIFRRILSDVTGWLFHKHDSEIVYDDEYDDVLVLIDGIGDGEMMPGFINITDIYFAVGETMEKPNRVKNCEYLGAKEFLNINDIERKLNAE
ncbi:hypothetical protein ANN_26684 [Periplaneta americana]|uniref:Uncharacterized protein n=1 Tax=Periplaneta americana TaxID=6978 RepID=A0ABQ8RZA5_PERAM|nr:hypothetical protein ANN_26684 [Periplaneta americana]